MQEIIYTIALSLLKNIGLPTTKILYETMGSATAVFENRKNITDALPDASQKLIKALNDLDFYIKRAEQELEFADKRNIRPLCLNNDAYPKRLKECCDAPLVLYYRGNGDLNGKHIVSMVGTRQCTEYGKDLCKSFVSEMAKVLPDTIIISGLAYGIDIHAHRAALECCLDTIGVLAHGLEKIYPSTHTATALEMANHGGVLTEYVSNTRIDKGNFVRRNRIIAGMCDACIVVESADKGGSLITADFANDYNRDVFAFPGRVFDKYSSGCNKLIRQNKAALIENADDLISVMGWDESTKKKEAKQLSLFDDDATDSIAELSDNERKIVECLKHEDYKSINAIVTETGIPYHVVSSEIFELETKGVVESFGSNRVKLQKNSI